MRPLEPLEMYSRVWAPTTKEKYTAIDLLDRALEFNAITAKGAKLWDSEKLKNNPPRFIRMQQILSLSKAFLEKETKEDIFFLEDNLHQKKGYELWVVEQILEGWFWKHRNSEDRELLMDYFINPLQYQPTKALPIKEILPIREKDWFGYQVSYLKLKIYKIKCTEILKDLRWSNKIPGTIENYRLPLKNVLVPFADDLEKSLLSINEALSVLINPHRLEFTKKELQEKYNFPKEDLSEIDEKYW